jgi:hypothetical protein
VTCFAVTQRQLKIHTTGHGATVCPHDQALLVQRLKITPEGGLGNLKICRDRCDVDASVQGNVIEDRRYSIRFEHATPLPTIDRSPRLIGQHAVYAALSGGRLTAVGRE